VKQLQRNATDDLKPQSAKPQPNPARLARENKGENMQTLNDALTHAATAYDRKQSKKRGYNHYALAHYFNAVELICTDINSGADPVEAIKRHTLDRVQDVYLKAAAKWAGQIVANSESAMCFCADAACDYCTAKAIASNP
jgi:hypothetical protein